MQRHENPRCSQLLKLYTTKTLTKKIHNQYHYHSLDNPTLLYYYQSQLIFLLNTNSNIWFGSSLGHIQN